MPLSTYILFGLPLDLCRIFWKALVIVIPIFSFKGITQAYLLSISITHNKNLIPFIKRTLFINCISAKSEPQILSIKGECTFLLLKFLIIGLSNSSDNFLLGILKIPLPKVFLSKNL